MGNIVAREKSIDIRGILADLFGTEKSNNDKSKNNEEQNAWEQGNKKILDISAKNIAGLEDMIRIPDRKENRTSTKKKMQGIVVEHSEISQTRKNDNVQKTKPSNQKEIIDD